MPACMHALGNSALHMLPNIGIAVAVFLLFLLVSGLTRRLVQHLNTGKYHKNLVIVLGRMSQWGLILLGLLLSVTIAFPSFTIGNLVSALGITGIAIGFAFKDIFENFLAGILILITEPFEIGDQIVFGGFEGTIEEIEARATKMRTYDGRLVVIGNGDDIQAAKRLMLDALKDLPGVEAEPAPDVLLLDYADNGVKLHIRWWITPPRKADALALQDQVLEAVKATLTAHGVDLPYPTQQILFHDQTETSDGNRRLQREGWPAGKGNVPAPAREAGAADRPEA